MLEPSQLRSLAADLVDIAIRVKNGRDHRVLHEVAHALMEDAIAKEKQTEALRELTRLSQEEGEYR